MLPLMTVPIPVKARPSSCPEALTWMVWTPAGIDAMAPGSYLVLFHLTG